VETVVADGAELLVEEASRLFRSARLGDTERICHQILRHEPNHAPALHLLGCVTLGTPAVAAAFIAKAISKQPGVAAYHNSLAVALITLAQHEDASDQLQRALELDSAFAPSWLNLGSLLLIEGEASKAISCLRRALDLAPDDPTGTLLLGLACRLAGLDGAARESYAVARATTSALNPAIAPFRSSDQTVALVLSFSHVLFSLYYQPRLRAEILSEVAAVWGDQQVTAQKIDSARSPNDLDPERQLRIGYVSGDFRRHPVGYFLDAVFRGFDRSRETVICYSTNPTSDDLQARLRDRSDLWRSLVGLDDQTAANLIRSDGIDILVDLAGHTAWNRLGIFARKAAPIQVTWLGFFGTTGLTTIDYILLDRYVCPDGDERLYTEKVFRLPETYLCYTPQTDDEVSPLPAQTSGGVTFGCFNRVAKLSIDVISTWSAILRRVPGSRLCLKDTALNLHGVRQLYAKRFAEEGIPAERITFLGKSPYVDHMRAHRQIDIALDPFPFNGGTTTVEALWMGVPVVTLAGDHFVSRMGVSHLNGVGLPELIASTPEEYVAKAVALAGDLPRLSALRAGLRGQMAASPLCDGASFTKGLEDAYRTMWRAWRQSQEVERAR